MTAISSVGVYMPSDPGGRVILGHPADGEKIGAYVAVGKGMVAGDADPIGCGQTGDIGGVLLAEKVQRLASTNSMRGRWPLFGVTMRTRWCWKRR
jgi:hypothetical protein